MFAHYPSRHFLPWSRRVPAWLIAVGFLCAFLASAPDASAQGTISLAWDQNPEHDIAGYIVEYGENQGEYQSADDVGLRFGHDLTGLTPGGTYYVVVRAYNDSGLQSPRSAEVVSTASGALLPPPDGSGSGEDPSDGSGSGEDPPDGSGSGEDPPDGSGSGEDPPGGSGSGEDSSSYALTITRAGAGTGSVTSSPSGINCGSDCSESYGGGVVVTLTAVPDEGSTFTGWNGDIDCADGTVTMDTDRGCLASFAAETNPGEDPEGYVLTITKSGIGSGTVTTSPAGIDCGSDCSEAYANGTAVHLTALPAADSSFAGWSGSGCGDAYLEMYSDRSCTASFTAVGGAPTVNGWATGSVEYYINPANEDVPEADAAAAVQVGASAWGEQSSADIALSYAGLTSATNVGLDSVNRVLFRPDANGDAVASVYLWVDNDGMIVDADIVFWDDSVPFYIGTSGCSGGAYIEDVSAHEFGHALGLAHSSHHDDTMYGSPSGCSTEPRTLSGNDIEVVEALYPPSGGEEIPAVPSNLTAAVNPAAPTSAVGLTWVDKADNEVGYSIERSTTSSNYLEVRQVGADHTSYTDQNLPSDTTFWYRVRALGQAGRSGHSNAASARTEAQGDETQGDEDQGARSWHWTRQGVRHLPIRLKTCSC